MQFPQMRNYVRLFATKAAAGLVLAGLLAVPVYLVSSPGQSLERPAQRLVGTARVLDGDTLEISGVRVRLEGIDAPELKQSCPHWLYGHWNAGHRAAVALRRMVDGRQVECASSGSDIYGRFLGMCRAGNVDLNREMVAKGYAWAFVRYSSRYVAEEAAARKARIGIWQSACDPAWTYREARWSGETSAGPGRCVIKGNITRRGERVYHMPWGEWYDKTKIEPEKGERWFCNEREAIEAGWRPSAS
jgi:endonuclease YncB( thermonuclease family)